MKPLIFALCVMCAFGSLSAQKPLWQPSPGHTQVPIWPGAAPDPQPVAGPEYAETSGKDFLPGGRQAVGVSNVTRPTMTVYSPKGKNTGAAVVVFPGGGYQVLAIDLEGTEVCDWLTQKQPAHDFYTMRGGPALRATSGLWPTSRAAWNDLLSRYMMTRPSLPFRRYRLETG